ncbi:hypothetical protein WPS_28260 [Vulcanimicrobium alpinum]|uniref:Glycosyltransferase n=1 Tax=Vulcanimicrobium alpinum TaxID=3016050 RepID=A0AAN1XY53_UNVUL|nr:glycosyltransferase [Vulcanimicrobium alpinum]BDE07550.1 hypothetical protein WPS_28260 [Vulcanimicrobium alpinum]
MKVLLVVRPDAAEKLGGDVVVAGYAHDALRALGVDADLIASTQPDLRGYDVAHVFGIFEPAFARPQIDAVRRFGTPLVVSPIWWDRTALFVASPRVERALARDARAATRAIARVRERERALVAAPGSGALRRLREQSALLAAADAVVAASEVEAFACSTGLGVTEPSYFIAHYAVEFADDDGAARAARAGVACIGRLESLKNQAVVLFALRDLDVDVTLVGRAYDERYAALCRRWATPRTRFVDRLAAEELRALFARSAVHVLASWGDLPGLVSLEAASLGARVIAGARGSEREYLGSEASYVDPLDVDGIRRAVVRALEAPPRPSGDALDRRLRARTWRRHAETLLDAYAHASGERR